jgi:hypothetical protein
MLVDVRVKELAVDDFTNTITIQRMVEPMILRIMKNRRTAKHNSSFGWSKPEFVLWCFAGECPVSICWSGGWARSHDFNRIFS